MPITIEDIGTLVEQLQQDAELQLRFARAFLTERTVRTLMQSDPQLREAFRNAVMTEELLRMPAQLQTVAETVERTEQRVAQLETRVSNLETEVAEVKQEVTEVKQEVAEVKQEVAEVKQEVAEVKQEVAEVKQEVAEVKQEVAEVKQEVAEVKQEVAEVRGEVGEVKQEVGSVKQELSEVKQEVGGLSSWRRGLDGRLAGEQYERDTVARAARILGMGEGGSPREDPAVRRQVVQWLAQGGLLETDGDEENEPLWADLIWWKGSRVALAEVSLKVDGLDVLRAKRRAEVLRQAGVDVMPMVIGKEWAHPETPELAKQEGVEWVVGNDYSDGVVAFRRIQST